MDIDAIELIVLKHYQCKDCQEIFCKMRFNMKSVIFRSMITLSTEHGKFTKNTDSSTKEKY